MNGFIGLLFLIGGLMAFFSPQTAWYLSIGWKLRDAEPSDAVLAWNRISGVILVLIGFIMVVSSCATLFTGGSQGRWAAQFQERVEAGEVSEIKIESYQNIYLTTDELTEIIALIRDAELSPFEKPTMYGYSGSGLLTFDNGDEVELILFGSSGGIELHPRDIDKAFKIESSRLESRISSYLNKIE
ncbi:MAG: hypothetical protein NAG76_22690 [Candidatus Pristimantibacillus lignocellulolyticus]|uniref:DUF6199 domain-containing protein n=1 Tax=Candidatus Pristimantibacillus lignocellulolyticus TaxID=2994561 RepID=A0A9J6ZEV6_9BACL|nr:MAG: hypothetical protein NAG76_22690 [Candidatus Pristimantibacillus lignocellulolyticus]